MIGRTKVFLKYYHVEELARLLEMYRRKVVALQRGWFNCQGHFNFCGAASGYQATIKRFECWRFEELWVCVLRTVPTFVTAHTFCASRDT